VEYEEVIQDVIEPKQVDVIEFPVEKDVEEEKPVEAEIEVPNSRFLKMTKTVVDLNDTMTSIATTVTDTDTVTQNKKRTSLMRFATDNASSAARRKSTGQPSIRRLSSAPTTTGSVDCGASSIVVDPESEVFQSLCKERVKMQTLKDKLKSEADEKKKYAALYERSKDKCNKVMDQLQNVRKELAKTKTESNNLKKENEQLKNKTQKLQKELQAFKSESSTTVEKSQHVQPESTNNAILPVNLVQDQNCQ
jgi:predicted RNase H-like nuclease (RuvC/YqgF family)